MVRNVIKNKDYRRHVACNKPLISLYQRKKYPKFARKHISKPLSFLELAFFNDESKFNILRSDGQVMVWRKSNQRMLIKNFCGTVKHCGGRIMLWEHMSAAGVEKLCFIKRNIDWYMHLDIWN